jgi:hypothetical protein
MSYAISDLIIDVLPRIGRMEKQTGITIYQAASSVQSIIYKNLLRRQSDLLASGVLSLTIPAYGCSAALPDDFVAMAEKPKSEEIYTDWMAGTVTSYNSTTGALAVNVTGSSGTDTLASWNIATAGTPGTPSTVIGTSLTSLTVGTAPQSLTATVGMTLPVGTYVIIFPTTMPTDLTPKRHHLDPSYLNDDDYDDYQWWEWYAIYGESFEPPVIRPRRYKIIGTTMYVRPKVIVDVNIIGKYFAKPSPFSLTTDTIPWNGLFDEVFREGVIKILVEGIAIPDADPAFAMLIAREVDTVVNTRMSLIPNTRRLKRGDYL